jgi:hypothetical protein
MMPDRELDPDILDLEDVIEFLEHHNSYTREDINRFARTPLPRFKNPAVLADQAKRARARILSLLDTLDRSFKATREATARAEAAEKEVGRLREVVLTEVAAIGQKTEPEVQTTQ